ncbi:MAG TPA: hypothetical protein VIF09_03160 [Polyangiaceae bacterium]
MHLSPFPGSDALLQDAIAIARTARSATVGWRTICVRAQRAVGRSVVQPIAGLDLDLDVPALSGRIHDLTADAPADVDTLVFGIFDGIPDGDVGFTGYHLAGAHGFDPTRRWLPEPSWVPDSPALVSPSLDTLARLAGEIRGPARSAVAHSLRFGAAALLSRFSASELPYRVVVAFEGGDCAEVSERRPVPRRSTIAAPLLTRI